MTKTASDRPSVLLNTVTAVLEEDGIAYQTEEPRLISFTIRGTTGSWSCKILIDEDEEWRSVIVTSLAPVTVPEARRASVSEWVIRKNYDTRIGSFQMDLSDGEVSYKTELLAADGVMTAAMFSAILDANLYMMDRCIQGLMMVAFGGVDPIRALEETSLPDDEEGRQLQ